MRSFFYRLYSLSSRGHVQTKIVFSCLTNDMQKYVARQINTYIFNICFNVCEDNNVKKKQN